MLHEALRLLRVYHDMKQVEAAAKLGISKSYLSEVENGKKEPTLDLINKYASCFDIPASSIMFFSENMNNSRSYDQAKNFVAGKIISLMQFLEQRSGVKNVDQQDI